MRIIISITKGNLIALLMWQVALACFNQVWGKQFKGSNHNLGTGIALLTTQDELQSSLS
jgi:hypothetical protein